MLQWLVVVETGSNAVTMLDEQIDLQLVRGAATRIRPARRFVRAHFVGAGRHDLPYPCGPVEKLAELVRGNRAVPMLSDRHALLQHPPKQGIIPRRTVRLRVKQ